MHSWSRAGVSLTMKKVSHIMWCSLRLYGPGCGSALTAAACAGVHVYATAWCSSGEVLMGSNLTMWYFLW